MLTIFMYSLLYYNDFDTTSPYLKLQTYLIVNDFWIRLQILEKKT
jgi:hypothetical protein